MALRENSRKGRIGVDFRILSFIGFPEQRLTDESNRSGYTTAKWPVSDRPNPQFYGSVTRSNFRLHYSFNEACQCICSFLKRSFPAVGPSRLTGLGGLRRPYIGRATRRLDSLKAENRQFYLAAKWMRGSQPKPVNTGDGSRPMPSSLEPRLRPQSRNLNEHGVSYRFLLRGI